MCVCVCVCVCVVKLRPKLPHKYHRLGRCVIKITDQRIMHCFLLRYRSVTP